MPKYKLADKDSESDFESDDGDSYTPDKHLGRGNSAEVRQFVSKKTGKSKAVVSPMDPSDVAFDEASNKFRFFKRICPSEPGFVVHNRKTYRLIVPLIPGINYNKLEAKFHIFNPMQQLLLFGSAINALKKAHAEKLILLDLHGINIHYYQKTGESFLVDGGTSVVMGEELDPEIFQQLDENACNEKTKEFPHIAPECWYLKDNSVTATIKMDVYSLGLMMLRLFRQSCSKLVIPLIVACRDIDPNKRPTLEQLEFAINWLIVREFSNYHALVQAARQFPSVMGPVAMLISALPESLRSRLVFSDIDKDVDILRKLVVLATEEEITQLAFIAVRMNYSEVLIALKHRHISLNLWHQGQSLAHVAAEEGHVNMIATLAKLDVELNAPDKKGITPVFVAAKEGHEAVIHEFQKQGVNLKSLNRSGQTLIHMAAKHGHAHLIGPLVFYGISANATSEAGESPIFMAVEHHYPGVLEKLVRYGVSLEARDVTGISLIQAAIEEGHMGIIEKLRKLGADFSKPFPNGKLPIEVAAQCKHESLVSYLEDLGFKNSILVQTF